MEQYFLINGKKVKVESDEFNHFVNTSIFYDDFTDEAVDYKFCEDAGEEIYEFDQETFDWWMERIEKLYKADEKKDDITEYDYVEWASDIIKAYRDELEELSTARIGDFIDEYFELASKTLEKLKKL